MRVMGGMDKVVSVKTTLLWANCDRMGGDVRRRGKEGEVGSSQSETDKAKNITEPEEDRRWTSERDCIQ